MNMFPLRIELWPEGEWWVANSPGLEVASQGHTADEALANIHEALELFIESCLERGTFEAVLAECDISTETTEKLLAHIRRHMPEACAQSQKCPA